MSILQIIILSVLWYIIGVTIAAHVWTLTCDLTWADLLFVCGTMGILGPTASLLYLFTLIENMKFSFDFLSTIIVYKKESEKETK
jgi:hypothetical protein